MEQDEKEKLMDIDNALAEINEIDKENIFIRIIKKIWSKNNLTIILAFMVLFNYLPLIILNYNTKQSFSAGTDTLVPAFGIGFVILFFFYIKKIKISKSMIVEGILLLIITLVWSFVQFTNYNSGKYYIMDVFNIACKVANVLFLFVLIINMELKEKSISTFMRLLVLLGIVSCVYNWLIYSEDILNSIKAVSTVQNNIFSKSFFAQKNQYAYVLFTCIVACTYLFTYNKKIILKIIDILLVGLFLFNMIFTFSRTGLVITGLFLGLYLIFNGVFKIWQKLILIIIVGIVGYYGITYVTTNNPELIDKIVRKQSIDTLTGRTDIWDVALTVANESKQTLIIGAGRFKGIDVINAAHLPFTQFHNTYIEFLVSGGIVELVYFIGIYLFVMIRIIISNKLELKYKLLYICLYISYFIYMFAESLGRFSIGGSDALGLIFFVSIPLLHSNSTKETN